MELNNLFFSGKRKDFFGPLTGKYREVVVACIRNLFLRLNGPEADYGYHITRRDIIDIFIESVRQTPILESMDTDIVESSRMSYEDRAAWVLKRLRDAGWIETYMDAGTMLTAYRFTPRGRQFAAPFAQRNSEIITNTQHTRSTLSHLKSFVAGLKKQPLPVNDLMIAAKLSGEIISDFNEIIEEIVEQRRDLISSVNKEIQTAKAAGENFFEFMEKRFIPDMTVRFSQDSVERFKNEILDLLDVIRNQPDSIKADLERELRFHYPNLLKKDRPAILLWALELIEQRLLAACEVKIPELRAQTENFIRRAQMLIDHLASLAFGEMENQSVFSLVQRMSKLNAKTLDQALTDPRSRLARLHIKLVNPAKIRPPKEQIKKEIESRLPEEPIALSTEFNRARVRQQIALAFRIEAAKVDDYVINQLAGGARITASDFKIKDAASLLGAIYAPLVGRKQYFTVLPLEEEVENAYYRGNSFAIE
ncbi:MAG: DUF5716 family protein, partial [Desulfobacteraceae bacterium]